MSEAERFSGPEGLLYGVPLSRPKDVVQWEQLEGIRKSQEALRREIQGSGTAIARRMGGREISEHEARREMGTHLMASISRFIGDQQRIAEECARISEHGFASVVDAQERAARVITEATRDQTAVQLAAFRVLVKQNERRDEILSAIDEGIEGIHKQGQVSLALQHDQIMTAQRGNELLAAMASALISRLDLSNQGLVHLSKQMDTLTDALLQGLQEVCLVLTRVSGEIGHQMAVTRLVVRQHFESLEQSVGRGLTLIKDVLSEANLKLEEILETLRTPRETSIAEACRIAKGLLEAGNFEGAMQCLEETKPDSHHFEQAHFLLGVAHYHHGNLQAAARCFGMARKYAGDRNIHIAEQSGTFLSMIALGLGDLSRSHETLRQLVETRAFAPHLKFAHLRFSALETFAGRHERAIASAINHMVVNPRSVPEVMESEFLAELLQEQNLVYWKTEIDDVVSKKLNFNAEAPFLTYFALSLFCLVCLHDEGRALFCLRTALLKWKEALLPLSKSLIEREMNGLDAEHAGLLCTTLFSLLNSEPEFYWLT